MSFSGYKVKDKEANSSLALNTPEGAAVSIKMLLLVQRYNKILKLPTKVRKIYGMWVEGTFNFCDSSKENLISLFDRPTNRIFFVNLYPL